MWIIQNKFTEACPNSAHAVITNHDKRRDYVCHLLLSMTRPRLSRFESAVQGLIEGTLGRFLGGRVEQAEIAAHLVRALEDSHEQGQTADTFALYLHPHDIRHLPRQATEQALADHLREVAQQRGILLPQRPQVILHSDEQHGRHQIRVVASRQTPLPSEDTQQFSKPAFEAGLAAQQAIQLVDAFVIVDGRTHIPLDKPLLTIGRQAGNDILLQSPVVSRQHAQIRWRYGRFVIYDIGSRVGTRVNEQPITECALRPGDVIHIGNVSLIYGEGSTAGRRKTNAPSPTADETLTKRPAELDEAMPKESE